MGSATSATSYPCPNRQKPPTDRPSRLSNTSLRRSEYRPTHDTAFPSKEGNQRTISKRLLPINHPSTLTNSYQYSTQDQSNVSDDNNNLKMGEPREYENNLEILQERLRTNATEHHRDRALPPRIKPRDAGFGVHSDRDDQPPYQHIRYLRKPRMKIGPEFMFENPENTTYSDNGEFVLEPVTNEQ